MEKYFAEVFTHDMTALHEYYDSYSEMFVDIEELIKEYGYENIAIRVSKYKKKRNIKLSSIKHYNYEDMTKKFTIDLVSSRF
jgi:virulence-associated protein VapD